MTTPHRLLVAHVRDFHRQPAPGMTWRELAAWHAGQHNRFGTDHRHARSDLGAGQRPHGWRSGDDHIIPKETE